MLWPRHETQMLRKRHNSTDFLSRTSEGGRKTKHYVVEHATAQNGYIVATICDIRRKTARLKAKTAYGQRRPVRSGVAQTAIDIDVIMVTRNRIVPRRSITASAGNSLIDWSAVQNIGSCAVIAQGCAVYRWYKNTAVLKMVVLCVKYRGISFDGIDSQCSFPRGTIYLDLCIFLGS